MNVDKIIKELKEYSVDTATNSSKEIYLYQEFNFDNFDTGVIINELGTDKFEVYLYVEKEGSVASRLFLKTFDNLENAKKYYTNLLDDAKLGNLDKIKEKLDTQK